MRAPRKHDGIVRHRPIISNTALPAMHLFARAGLIRRKLLRSRTEALMR